MGITKLMIDGVESKLDVSTLSDDVVDRLLPSEDQADVGKLVQLTSDGYQLKIPPAICVSFVRNRNGSWNHDTPLDQIQAAYDSGSAIIGMNFDDDTRNYDTLGGFVMVPFSVYDDDTDTTTTGFGATRTYITGITEQAVTFTKISYLIIDDGTSEGLTQVTIVSSDTAPAVK